MTTLYFIILILWVYTCISITWVVSNMGNKYRKGRWYDWIIGGPALLIAYIFGYFNK